MLQGVEFVPQADQLLVMSGDRLLPLDDARFELQQPLGGLFQFAGGCSGASRRLQPLLAEPLQIGVQLPQPECLVPDRGFLGSDTFAIGGRLPLEVADTRLDDLQVFISPGD